MATYAWILSRFRKVAGEDASLWVHGAAFDVTARHEAEELRRRLEGEYARAAALELESPPGGGTVVRARAPVR